MASTQTTTLNSAAIRIGSLTLRADGSLTADVEFDAGRETVNALDIQLQLPSADRVVRIEDGSTIVNAWIERPAVHEDGILSFSGIIPGGFSGTQGRVVTIVFSGDTPFAENARLVTGDILKNDGLGTAIPFDFSTASWQTIAVAKSALGVDRTPPEEFFPEVVQDPGLYDGRPTLIFAAEDKQSGIDHYQVLEVPQAGGWNADVGSWQETQSPYLLTDPSRASTIYVRAVDTAGNFRLVSVAPALERPRVPFPGAYPAAFGAILVLLAVTILWFALRARARS